MKTSKNSRIKKIKAREILDSKGNPTVEVDLFTDLGLFRASVPSGISTGKTEAVELRDNEERYRGKGVLTAVRNVDEIMAPKFIGENDVDQERIDRTLIELDGTKNKSRLGANSILAVSLAVCRAAAEEMRLPLYRYLSHLAGTKPLLPRPCLLVIEGGRHASNKLDFQEFIILPEADSFKERLQRGTEIYHCLGSILEKTGDEAAANVGYEGGFTPALEKTEEALKLIVEAINQAGYERQVKIIIDAAASTFFKSGKYHFEGKKLNKEALLSFYAGMVKNYPLFAIEDPFSEDDFEGFTMMTEKLGKKIFIIGDDLLTTNIERIRKAERLSACNGLILKPNQVGTVTETLEAASEARKNHWQVFVKHRGGETNDDFIADLATGLGTGWIMAGAPARGERVAKYNRLLRIEEELNA